MAHVNESDFRDKTLKNFLRVASENERTRLEGEIALRKAMRMQW